MASCLSSDSADFHGWQQARSLERLKDGERLNEVACRHLLDEFLKLLQWYCQTDRGDVDDIAASQALCYTDLLLEIFSDPSICVQLQASKLLQAGGMKIFRYIVKISPRALEADEAMTSKFYT